MKEMWFVAVERFDPSDGGWKKYIEWSGLVQLREVISLDSMLCHLVIDDPLKEDYGHMPDETMDIFLFRDREYLADRVKNIANKHLLAVVLEPGPDDHDRQIQGGYFVGYDLVERDSGISALTNCGGFPVSFENQELNEYGLISEYGRAKKVQTALVINNPDEPHAQTELWAIWKLED